MKPFRIVNARIVTSQGIIEGDILVEPPFIIEVGRVSKQTATVFDVEGRYVLPGAIDLHVHFRQPGLEYKATIETESKAALRGGVTSFIDMPNTIPETTSYTAWRDKMNIAQELSWINYAFYPGVTPDNIDELPEWTQHPNVPAVKAFLARSTGNLLINLEEFEHLLEIIDVPVAVHSELESIVRNNSLKLKNEYFPEIHMYVRPPEACYQATQSVISLARKYHKHVHILHLSTKEEVDLLIKDKPETVSIETCPQYLFFDSSDYYHWGNWIKCNPSIKRTQDREALQKALNSVIDTIGTDHAPHLVSEKIRPYWKAPSGIPSIEGLIPLMTTFVENGNISWHRLVQLISTNPAKIYKINARGDISEGMYADLVVLERQTWKMRSSYHRCGWNPYLYKELPYRVGRVFVNGTLSYVDEGQPRWIVRNPMPLRFR